jgi:hypothetical protein
MHEGRRKSDTLPGVGCEDCRSRCEACEGRVVLPFRLPGSAGISEGFMPDRVWSLLE